MFSVHPEPCTLIVRKGKGIDSFVGLRGQTVNIGTPGSGQRATMQVVIEAFGINKCDFALAAEFKGSEQPQTLCDGKINAMIYTIGHPAAAVKQAAKTCDLSLVSVTGAPIDKLIAKNLFYRATTVPGGMYKGTDDTITTFGVGATFITSTDVSEKAVYTVVKGISDNFADFKKNYTPPLPTSKRRR